jgi:hypothetical protein
MSASNNTCPGGYWRRSSNPSSDCAPAGEGFFSPDDNDSRYPCPPGSFAADVTTAICTDCPPGSFSAEAQAVTCQYCPSASYAEEAASQECVRCNDLYYAGLASDYAILLSGQQTGLLQGDLFCIEPLVGPIYSKTPTASPSLPNTPIPSSKAPTPTMAPTGVKPDPSVTKRPTDSPTMIPAIAGLPTTLPTNVVTKSLAPSVFSAIQGADTGGQADDNTWHLQYESNFWLPILLSLTLTIAVIVKIWWSSQEAREKEEQVQEAARNEPESPRQRAPSEDSASTVFMEETPAEEICRASSSRRRAGPYLPNGAASGIWSLSTTTGRPYDEDSISSEDSGESGIFSGVLSV